MPEIALAAVEHRDLFPIHVVAEHPVAGIVKRANQRQTDVTEPHHRDQSGAIPQSRLEASPGLVGNPGRRLVPALRPGLMRNLDACTPCGAPIDGNGPRNARCPLRPGGFPTALR